MKLKILEIFIIFVGFISFTIGDTSLKQKLKSLAKSQTNNSTVSTVPNTTNNDADSCLIFFHPHYHYCSLIKYCGLCASSPHCGWCNETNRCLPGTIESCVCGGLCSQQTFWIYEMNRCGTVSTNYYSKTTYYPPYPYHYFSTYPYRTQAKTVIIDNTKGQIIYQTRFKKSSKKQKRHKKKKIN